VYADSMNEESDKRRLKPAATGTQREKRHRLPREHYRGQVNVALTLCVASKAGLFADSEVLSAFVSLLTASAKKHDCVVLIYCFMPDHVHLLLSGQSESSDTWAAVVRFKQQTGFWLGRHRQDVCWQKDFFDHIIRRDEDLGAQVRYIAGNPVRKNLVRDWRGYPFTGSVGADLNAIVSSTITL
jgi:REP-associated tyrosine transposase